MSGGTDVAASTDVWVVAYGDEVHIYPHDAAEMARTLHMVGQAAYGDGGIHQATAERWAQAAPKLRGLGIPVKDHR